jgi:hypothetical protein
VDNIVRPPRPEDHGAMAVFQDSSGTLRVQAFMPGSRQMCEFRDVGRAMSPKV